ncbi:MAG TPA: hypothetical protein VFQ36_19415 [Ktedonobacteraceae bacterium]|nr:hypothetical protein [Ktedonobacteraceae bacterium]
MAKTLADVEKKIDILDETEEVHTGRGWKFWVIAPLVLTVVGGGAFLAVRRLFGSSES